MSTSSAAGRLRPLTDADIPAAVEFINAAMPDDPVDEPELRRWLTNPAGAWEFALVEDEEGRPVAYLDVDAPAEAPDRGWIDLRLPPASVAPELLDLVLGWAEDRLRLKGRALARTFSVSGSPLAPLLEERGYRPARHSFRMRIDLEAAPSPPHWPVGIEARPIRLGQERLVHRVLEDAFADHWEFFPTPYDEWAHFMVDEDFDPGLWILAWDGDELAGVSLCRRQRPGRPGVGWVRELGVRRPWRRRGLGLALLVASFGAFWERGTKVVGLGVDGESTTGAVRLYERAGMRVEHRRDMYERRLS